MSTALRLTLFGVACLVLLIAVWHVALHLPAFGAHPLPYGDAINTLGPAQMHVSNMVSAVNFGYRGFDTVGEEFMLLCAVTGTVVLLRGTRGEQVGAKPGRVPGRTEAPSSEAFTLIARLFAPIIVVFGVYVALHAMTTPGGGFQGGVIVAGGLLLVYLGEGYPPWRRVVKSHLFDFIEAFGALLFAGSGLLSLAMGKAYLTNVLPLGKFRHTFAGGLMQIENAGVAMAVCGGFAVLFVEFLEETRAVEEGQGPGPESVLPDMR